ncbi:hypothetical protein QYE76_048182 [Lolium multiflorum]|uniref:Uncharacterized protein n=1 Tax=Lolium multiflorum TaxID=4521 RepID=A0AAD8VEX8_LOLMU|nr:hypothetical protein QYE76_048182 [Lolium multiflorum]
MRLHFNALEAFREWKEEALTPVQVPTITKWKFRSNPSDQVILDYDYTFTTPYCGMQTCLDECSSLCWQHTDDQMDLVALSAKEPIIFYDELQSAHDNGPYSVVIDKVNPLPSTEYYDLIVHDERILQHNHRNHLYKKLIEVFNLDPYLFSYNTAKEVGYTNLAEKCNPHVRGPFGVKYHAQALKYFVFEIQWL